MNATSYDVSVVYHGNEWYNESSTTGAFTVIKNPIQINIAVTNSTVGSVEQINVTLNNTDASGKVFLDINGQHYYADVTGGFAQFNITGLEAGKYEFNVTYSGNYKYLANNATSTLTVSKLNTTVRIEVANTTYDGSSTIVVHVDSGVEGNITLRINNTMVGTFAILDGKVNVTVKLGAENYTVYAEYNGNYKFNVNKTESKDFTVARAVPVITIDKAITDANTSAVITVHINDTATGTLNITVNNKNYNATIVNGVAVFTVDVLPVGEYNITANYYALTDSNYTVGTATLVKGLNVTKVAAYPMNVTAIDVAVGVNTTITVYVPSDANGTVTIWVNGIKMNMTANNAGGVVVFHLNKTREGKYAVNATLSDDKYGNQTVFTEYYVYRWNTPIVIGDISPQTVGETTTITVTVPSDIDVNLLTLEINGKLYDNGVKDGSTVTFTINDLTHGDKTVVATYTGDNKYRFNSTTGKFTVNKHDSTITVDATNKSVSEDVVINVTVTPGATGYVVVNVDGNNYTINLTSGQDRVVIKGLRSGEYDVVATYIGDENYKSSYDTTSFKVSKVDSSVSVTVNNITVGDVAAVNITVISTATGNVTITIGDEYNKTFGVIDGEMSIIVPGLTYGNKTVNVVYNGDDKYLPSSDSANFTVASSTIDMVLVAQNITYGEVATIIAYVNAAGSVTFKIEGYPDETVEIIDGKATYTINLNAGNYTVEAIYESQSGFVANSQVNFTVEKADPTISVEVENIAYGEAEYIIVHVNADGYVTIKVNGTDINETISLDNGEREIILRATALGDNVPNAYEGNATLIIRNLKGGNYVVEVTYNGNENFNKGIVIDKFTVGQSDVSINAEAEPSVPAGESQVINITMGNTNATGNVTIIVGDANYTVPLDNGATKFTVPVLPSGNYTAVVIYNGDRNFNGNWTYVEFEVEKAQPSVSVDVTHNPTGDDQTVTVTVDKDDAKGYVIVDVDGKPYAVELDKGTGSITISGLAAGNHTITAKYLGDDKYEPSSDSTELKLSKLHSDVSVNAENITVGDKAVIEITVPENATGNVTVNVDGTDYRCW